MGNMNLYLYDTLVTAEELRQKFDEIDPTACIELAMVDEDGNLWFEVTRYGIYY